MPLKDITNRILFVLAGNKYVYQIIFDGSYFVPYFTCKTSNKQMSKATLYCLSVWNVVKDHLA